MVENTDIKEPEAVLAETTPRSLCMRKGERLHHRNVVEALFDRGKSEYAYPLRMFYLVVGKDNADDLLCPSAVMEPVQMMVTVPKKKFKRAVDRVWLRRRIREAYRLNRLSLKDLVERDERGRSLLLAFIYVGSDKAVFGSIEKKMVKLLDKAKAAFELQRSRDDKADHNGEVKGGQDG